MMLYLVKSMHIGHYDDEVHLLPDIKVNITKSMDNNYFEITFSFLRFYIYIHYKLQDEDKEDVL